MREDRVQIIFFQHQSLFYAYSFYFYDLFVKRIKIGKES